MTCPHSATTQRSAKSCVKQQKTLYHPHHLENFKRPSCSFLKPKKEDETSFHEITWKIWHLLTSSHLRRVTRPAGGLRNVTHCLWALGKHAHFLRFPSYQSDGKLNTTFSLLLVMENAEFWGSLVHNLEAGREKGHYFHCCVDWWVGCGRCSFMCRSRPSFTSGWAASEPPWDQTHRANSLTPIPLDSHGLQVLIFCVKDFSAQKVVAGTCKSPKRETTQVSIKGKQINKINVTLKWDVTRE